MRALTVAWTLVLLSGCLGDASPDEASEPEPASGSRLHATTGLVEPAELEPPTFAPPVVIAEGGPAYAMGEPGVWAHLDGTLYAAIPGCDNLSLLLPGCEHGMIWKSVDGLAWERMNQASNGHT